MNKNKNLIAMIFFGLSLVGFGGYVLTKEYAFFLAAIACMIVGVSLTPRKRK